MKRCLAPNCTEVATHMAYLETIGEESPTTTQPRCAQHLAGPDVIEVWTFKEWNAE